MTPVTVNGKRYDVDLPADTPLLWALRDYVGLTGTKFGCGMALCGACTVHLEGEPVRACAIPVAEAQGKSVTTIEGVRDTPYRAVQEAWIEESVPQCGYCQSGQIMSAIALLRARPRPSDNDIDAAMSANLCRCATYVRIRRAIHRAAETLGLGETGAERK